MEYGEPDDARGQLAPKPSAEPSCIRSAKRLINPVEQLDVIGAGNFVRTMLLPSLRGMIPLGTIVNNTALSANHVRDKFGFVEASTDPEATLGQAGAGAVLIGTRNHLHAPMVMAALKSGRHVFVEKPLCLSLVELAEIDATVSEHPQSVQVGFNRRFAPAAKRLRDGLAGQSGPKVIQIRINAGAIEAEHWVHAASEGGGRLLGEACHFIDLARFLVAEPIAVVSAEAAQVTDGASAVSYTHLTLPTKA